MLVALAGTLRSNASLTDIDCEIDLLYHNETAFAAIGEALLRCPRYIHHGINSTVLEYTHSWHLDRALAFSMGMHARLGSVSAVHVLRADHVAMVLSCFYGMPLEYLTRPPREPEYLEALRLAG